MLTEAIAKTDEVLLEKFFEEGEPQAEEICRGLINGCIAGDIAPVMTMSVLTKARGSFTYTFERYEEVLELESKKILESTKK